MRYHALATDYDGTLARDGHVDDETTAALERLRASGRRLVVVTGRRAGDLLASFPRADLCDRIVAENGATLYRPETHDEVLLAAPADERLVAALQEDQVEPLSVGRVVVATDERHLVGALHVAGELRLDVAAHLNRGAAMLLPVGVDKGTGLLAALDDLGVGVADTVGVGDAENDGAFLRLCGLSAAVANALPELSERVDVVARSPYGAGVREIVEAMLGDYLAEVAQQS
ncbi:MAG TPA: HAD family hydrolase [Thermoleophilia bacterium]|nr:HAD family hydrolase [Thermoleophilia bacterium]